MCAKTHLFFDMTLKNHDENLTKCFIHFYWNAKVHIVFDVDRMEFSFCFFLFIIKLRNMHFDEIQMTKHEEIKKDSW